MTWAVNGIDETHVCMLLFASLCATVPRATCPVILFVVLARLLHANLSSSSQTRRNQGKTKMCFMVPQGCWLFMYYCINAHNDNPQKSDISTFGLPFRQARENLACKAESASWHNLWYVRVKRPRQNYRTRHKVTKQNHKITTSPMRGAHEL